MLGFINPHFNFRGEEAIFVLFENKQGMGLKKIVIKTLRLLTHKKNAVCVHCSVPVPPMYKVDMKAVTHIKVFYLHTCPFFARFALVKLATSDNVTKS